MIDNGAPVEIARRSGVVGRSVGVMAAWYAGLLLILAAWLGPGLAKPEVEPVRQCAPTILSCHHTTSMDLIDYLVVPPLLSSLIASFITLALMVRHDRGAMASGTIAAVFGWLAGPLALLLLAVVWFLVLAIMHAH
jgi:hypothetical protein